MRRYETLSIAPCTGLVTTPYDPSLAARNAFEDNYTIHEKKSFVIILCENSAMCSSHCT